MQRKCNYIVWLIVALTAALMCACDIYTPDSPSDPDKPQSDDDPPRPNRIYEKDLDKVPADHCIQASDIENFE